MAITVSICWLVVSNIWIIFHNNYYGMSSETHWRTPSFFKMVIAPPSSIYMDELPIEPGQGGQRFQEVGRLERKARAYRNECRPVPESIVCFNVFDISSSWKFMFSWHSCYAAIFRRVNYYNSARYVHNWYTVIGLPYGNQTWFAGQCPIYVDDVPIWTPI